MTVEELNSYTQCIWISLVAARCISVLLPVACITASHMECETCFLMFNLKYKHNCHPFQRWPRHRGTYTIYSMDEYYLFERQMHARKLWLPLKISICFEGEIRIETGWSWKAMVNMKIFENAQCSIRGFACSNMCYINSYYISSVVGQWKINYRALVCNKSERFVA